MLSFNDLYALYLQTKSVTVDSRHVTPNTLFFALPGQRVEGGEFALEALEKGAAYAIVDADRYQHNSRCLRVHNTLATLQKLAQYHRLQKAQLQVVALTGSVGKTTTKALIGTVLATRYHTFVTPGNFNTDIGLPISLLNMPEHIEVAVLEMGARAVGEIATLCRIAQPTHGLVTNVHPVHVESFGSLSNIVQTKAELYAYLQAHRGIAFVHEAETALHPYAYAVAQNHTYGASEASYIQNTPYLYYQADGKVHTTKLLGTHLLPSVQAARVVATHFQVPHQLQHQALSSYRPQGNRGELLRKRSNTILLDSYNASPVSMEASLVAFNTLPGFQKIAVLGDMNELGAESNKAHQHVINLALQGNYTKLILCGPQYYAQRKPYHKALFFLSKAELITYLKAQSWHNTTFLLKASRSFAFETLLPLL